VIAGAVGADGVPVIPIQIAGQAWRAAIDTGFNGDLELPNALRTQFGARFIGRTRFLLAAGQTAVEDTFLVNFPFDGDLVLAEATFSSANDILMGTGMLRQHRLEIHFPNRTVTLMRVA
jgi:predicted aspartyl protease